MTHRVALGSSLALLLIATFVPLLWSQQQICFAIIAVLISFWCWKRRAGSRTLSLFLALMSVTASARYLLWRGSTVAGGLRQIGPWSFGHVFVAIAQLALLTAELLWIVEILFGYLQTAWPLRRSPVPLTPQNEFWPPVEVLLKTQDEPLAMVKAAAFAALNLDWPAEKLNIALWDQGSRAKVQAFCAQTGIGYVAGSVNEPDIPHSLSNIAGRPTAPYIAIFSVQQPPVRSFLQLTVGWLERDSKLAYVQTKGTSKAHSRFTSLLNRGSSVQSSMMSAAYQDGRDLWNLSSFEGAAAILRKEVLALLEPSGTSADSTRSNDVPLQNQGWRSAYLAVAQTALRAERENPRYVTADLTGSAHGHEVHPRAQVSMAQRVLSFYTKCQPVFIRSRCTFLLAPFLASVFALALIPGRWPQLLEFAIPHLTLAALTRARLESWSLLGIGSSNSAVTGHGKSTLQGGETGSLESEPPSQTRVLRVLLFLLANIVALTACGIRLFLQTRSVQQHAAPVQVSLGLLWILAGWAAVNLVLIGAASAPARRRAEVRRKAWRTDVSTHVSLTFADGTSISGFSSNASTGGMLVRVTEEVPASHGQNVTMRVAVLDASISVPATIVAKDGLAVHLQFRPRTPEQEEAIAVLLYSRADAWLNNEQRAHESILPMLGSTLQLAWRGWSSALRRRTFSAPKGTQEKMRFGPVWAALVVVPLLSLVAALSVLLFLQSRVQKRQPPVSAVDTPFAGGNLASMKTSVLTPRPAFITADGPLKQEFSIPQTEVARKAALEIRYTRSERLRAEGGLLLVELNDTEIARLPLGAASPPSKFSLRQIFSYRADVRDVVRSVALPPELVVSTNHLALRLQLSKADDCRAEGCRSDWLRIEPGSLLEVSTMPLHSRSASKLKSVPVQAAAPGVLSPKPALNARSFQVRQICYALAWTLPVFLLCLLSASLLDRSLLDQARYRLDAGL